MSKKSMPSETVIRETLELAVLHGKENLSAIERSLDARLPRLNLEQGDAVGDTPDRRMIKWIVNDYINKLPPESVKGLFQPHIWVLRDDYEQLKVNAQHAGEGKATREQQPPDSEIQVRFALSQVLKDHWDDLSYLAEQIARNLFFIPFGWAPGKPGVFSIICNIEEFEKGKLVIIPAGRLTHVKEIIGSPAVLLAALSGFPGRYTSADLSLLPCLLFHLASEPGWDSNMEQLKEALGNYSKALTFLDAKLTQRCQEDNIPVVDPLKGAGHFYLTEGGVELSWLYEDKGDKKRETRPVGRKEEFAEVWSSYCTAEEKLRLIKGMLSLASQRGTFKGRCQRCP